MTNDEQELQDIEELSERLNKSLPKNYKNLDHYQIAIGKVNDAIEERYVNGKIISVTINWQAIHWALNKLDKDEKMNVLSIVEEYCKEIMTEVDDTFEEIMEDPDD